PERRLVQPDPADADTGSTGFVARRLQHHEPPPIRRHLAAGVARGPGIGKVLRDRLHTQPLRDQPARSDIQYVKHIRCPLAVARFRRRPGREGPASAGRELGYPIRSFSAFSIDAYCLRSSSMAIWWSKAFLACSVTRCSMERLLRS